MSTKLKAVEQAEVVQQGPAGDAGLTEELPPLEIDPTSFDARIAGIEPCSVIRELSQHHAGVSAFKVKQAELRGEVKTHADEERVLHEAWERQWEKRPEDLAEYVEFIKRKAVRYIDWGDVGQLWNASPRDAMELWRAIRLEARDEFLSGHYGARPFEALESHHEVFRRAQYLAVRDGLVEEWRPRGASEFILIDQMTQAYVMQLHWTEEAMRRAQGEPRVESYDYREWKEHRRAQAKANQWETGHWDVPYQREAEAVEQAFRIVELCAKSFQRAMRQLANIRLVRAKTARTRRRERVKTLKAVKVA
jgi:hypothetical protein